MTDLWRPLPWFIKLAFGAMLLSMCGLLTIVVLGLIGLA